MHSQTKMTTNEQNLARNIITNHHYGRGEGREEQARTVAVAEQRQPPAPNLQQQHSPSQSSLSSHVTMEQVFQSQQYAIAAAAWSSSVFMSDLYQRNLFERFILPAATVAAASVAGGMSFARIAGNGLANVQLDKCSKPSRPTTRESNLESTPAASSGSSDNKGYPEKPIRRRRPRRGKRKRRCRKRKHAVDGVHETSFQSTSSATNQTATGDGTNGKNCINKQGDHNQPDRQQIEVALEQDGDGSLSCHELTTSAYPSNETVGPINV